MYRGVSKCQGCGRPGDIAPRASRLLLCDECQQMLLIGVAITQRYKTMLAVTEEGAVYCQGQKCEIYKGEDIRCKKCPVGKMTK